MIPSNEADIRYLLSAENERNEMLSLFSDNFFINCFEFML